MPFVLNDYHRNTSDEELIADLQNVASLLNSDTVTMDEYNLQGRYHSTTLRRRFGSWFRCLEVAGLRHSRAAINIPEHELLDDIERVWILLGKQPSYSQMQKYTHYSMGTYENRFGGWRNALECFIEYINASSHESISAMHTNDPTFVKSSRTINQRLRFLVLARDNFSCRACGASPAKDGGVTKLHVDHIIPWSKGGQTVIDNLQTLCEKCNLGKSNIEI